MLRPRCPVLRGTRSFASATVSIWSARRTGCVSPSATSRCISASYPCTLANGLDRRPDSPAGDERLILGRHVLEAHRLALEVVRGARGAGLRPPVEVRGG